MMISLNDFWSINHKVEGKVSYTCKNPTKYYKNEATGQGLSINNL